MDYGDYYGFNPYVSVGARRAQAARELAKTPVLQTRPGCLAKWRAPEYRESVVPWSMAVGFDPAKLHPWTRDCAFWLKEQGFTK